MFRLLLKIPSEPLFLGKTDQKLNSSLPICRIFLILAETLQQNSRVNSVSFLIVVRHFFDDFYANEIWNLNYFFWLPWLYFS